MKAVVMAGGEGSRLRPITAGRPKPMTELFDRPLLEYTVALLKKHGIEDICFTLGYLPQVIEEYFKNGQDFGVKIEYRTEKEPLGTAGGVRACLDFLDGDDALIISGDALCDFDLKKCIKAHKEKEADATIVLYEHNEPTEYGLVVTEKSGRIKSFIEKPDWSRVLTNRVNTGIYILSNETVKSIPEGKYDFGSELFPKMLRENKALFAVTAKGYWCDVGNPGAYINCVKDALMGKIDLPVKNDMEQSPVPEGCRVEEPCYIGPGCYIATGAHIGPFAALGAGSRIKDGAKVQGCVINGAEIGEGAGVLGAYVGKNVRVGEKANIRQGAVIGDLCDIGKGAVVQERVKMWPGCRAEENTVVSRNMKDCAGKALSFSEDGSLTGEYAKEFAPADALVIGGALASFGRVGVASSGESFSKLMASAVSCGVVAAGGSVFETDCALASALSFSCREFGLKCAVFVSEENGAVKMTFFDETGERSPGGVIKKVDAALKSGERPEGGVGEVSPMLGIQEAYVARAVRETGAEKARGMSVSVTGTGAGNRLLKKAAALAGLRERGGAGVPEFSVSRDGFSLFARDEQGREISSEKMYVVAALAALMTKTDKVAVPYDAPAVLDTAAKAAGGEILRLYRDGEEAKNLYGKQWFLKDGVFSALTVMCAMAQKKLTLRALAEMVPDFCRAEKTVAAPQGRAAAMYEMSLCDAFENAELYDGILARTEGGRVKISPCLNESSIRIAVEAATFEAAGELCADMEKLAGDILK